MRTIRAKLICWIVTALFAMPVAAVAQITRIVIDRVESPTYGGQRLGDVGQYEKLVGRAFGEVDPSHPLNAGIQDIELAPTNARGRVEYVTDFYLIKPVDMSKGNHTLVHNVINRGNKGQWNIGVEGRNEPTGPGDGFLEKRGFAMLWSGWQGDILRTNGRLSIDVPVAKNPDGSEITGEVRTEYVQSEPAKSLPLSEAPYTTGTRPYETVSLDNTTATLTQRVREGDARQLIPKSDWAFADCRDVPFPGRPSTKMICPKDGFDTNHIYELIYTAKNPTVLGLGYAAIRDLLAFFRQEAADGSGTRNPLAGQIQNVEIWGSSQTGAALRAFIHLGFNEDVNGRRVADGAHVRKAAGIQPLSVRFGQPGRAPFEHTQHLFPRYEAPLSWMPTFDPLRGRTGGILARCMKSDTCPKIVSTFTSSEFYNHRISASMTDALATKDLPLPENVRMYFVAGTPHGTGGGPPRCKYPGNPNDSRYAQRAAFDALHKWVTQNIMPPASKMPTLRDGTLVSPQVDSPFGQIDWPAIPGITYTGLVNRFELLDFGPHFRHEDVSGIITENPPRRISREYRILVPQVDADGNDLGGIRSNLLLAPTATYTGFNERGAGYSEGGFCDNRGIISPFPKTRAERLATGDPRLSLEERYKNHAGYMAAVRAAAEKLVAERYLLPEDAATIIAEAEASDVLRRPGNPTDMALVAQTPPIIGDRSSPLRPLSSQGNVGISNALLRDQPEVRALRVVVDPGGTRVIHAHTGVQFHLFVPISGPMELNLDGGQSVDVQPWHPYFMEAGTRHGFHNSSSVPVEIMEIFVR